MGVLSQGILMRGMRISKQHKKLWGISRRLTPSGGHRQQHYHGTPSFLLARILCTDNIDPSKYITVGGCKPSLVFLPGFRFMILRGLEVHNRRGSGSRPYETKLN